MQKYDIFMGGRIQSFRVRILLSLGAFLVYALLFLSPYISRAAIGLAILPILITASIFGRWGGLAAGVISIPINTLLYILVGERELSLFSLENLWILHTGFVVFGFVAGYFRDLKWELTKGLAEYKRVDAARRVSEEQFRQLAENSHNALVIYDRSVERVVYANPATAKIFGVPLDEILTYGIIEISQRLIHEDDRSRLMTASQTVRQARERGETYSMDLEFRIIRTDGKIRWIHQRSYSILTEGVPVTQFYAIFSDITERQQQERTVELQREITARMRLQQMLRESREKYRSVLDNANAAIQHYDIDGTIRLFNRQAAENMGGEPRDFVDKSLFELLPDFAEKYRKIFREVARTGEAVEQEYAVSLPTGQRWFWSSFQPVKDFISQKVTGIRVTSSDITERKRVEEARRESEEKFRVVAEQSMIGIAIIQDGYYKFANKTLSMINEYSIDEMMNFPQNGFAQQFPSEELDFIMEQARKKQAGEKNAATHYECGLICKSGIRKEIEVYSTTIKYRGRFANLVTVLDITERRRAEEELANQSTTLSTIFENAPYILALVDEEVRFERINHKGVAFSGKKKEDLLGKLSGDVFNCINALKGEGCGNNPICSHCPVRTRVESTFQTGKPHAEEEGVMTILQHGKEITTDLIISTSVVTIQGSEKVLLSVVNNTRRKQAEEALRESEERYRSIVTQASDGIVLYNLETKLVLESNHTYQEMLGYTTEEMRALTLYDIVAHDRQSVNNYIQRIKAEKKVWIGQRKHNCKDGTLIDVEVSSSLLTLNGSKVLSTVVRDITERVQAEEAIKEQAREISRSNAFTNMLSDISAHIGSSLDTHHIMETLSIELRKMGLTCAIITLDSAAQTVLMQYDSIDSQTLALAEKMFGLKLRDYSIPREKWGPFVSVLDHGQPKFVPKLLDITTAITNTPSESTLRRAHQLVRISPDDPVIGLPLIAQEQPLGALIVWGKGLEEKDIPTFSVFAGQVATMLENARLYEAEHKGSMELARSNAFIESLSRAGARIQSLPEPERIFKTLGTEIRELGLDCIIFTTEQDGTLSMQYISVKPKFIALGEKMLGLKMSAIRMKRDVLPQTLFEQKQPLIWGNRIDLMAAAMPKVPKKVVAQVIKLGGYSIDDIIIYLPLVIEDHALGYIGVWGEGLTKEDTPALSVFAGQVAVALENARLYTIERERSEELAHTGARLETSLQEKDVLLKEIHHRVKNNLQIISSLLNLQSAQIKDEQTLAIFAESRDRVRSMALIHEKLYQSPDLAQVEFEEYTRSLVAQVMHAYHTKAGVIALQVDMQDVVLSVDVAMPCGLIINELVSNALKYAFPDGRDGKLWISMRTEQDKTALEVGNDGVRFPDNIDFRNTESLGLQLVIMLVKQLEGSIELDRSKGTAFRIIF